MTLVSNFIPILELIADNITNFRETYRDVLRFCFEMLENAIIDIYHPKLNFIVSVEKEIIGQGTVKKADDTMSFVDITFEKEPGVVQKNAKIQRLANVNYPDPNVQAAQKIDPTKGEEWLPPPIPQFGFAYAGFGFTDYKMNSILLDGTTLDSGSSFAPTFNLGAELWVTKNLIAQFSYRQVFFAGKNSYEKQIRRIENSINGE